MSIANDKDTFLTKNNFFSARRSLRNNFNEEYIKKQTSGFDDLKKHYKVLYDQQGSIGKRYYRQDEAGTPFCITIDHQSNKDNTVTLRDRDSQDQDRVAIENLVTVIQNKIDTYS